MDRRRMIACLLVPAGLGWAVSLAGQTPTTIAVRPDAVRIGAFYAGADLEVSGLLPAGAQAIVVVRGPDAEERFNTKGRFGPIWANAGGVRISGVPSLFLAFSSRPVALLLARAQVDRRQLDERAIEAQMKVEPPARDRREVRANYLKLKAGQGMLRVEEGSVRVQERGDRTAYAVSFRWPKKAPPARYTVTAFAVRDGAIVGEASAELPVTTAGVPARLADLARQRATLYGILCVLAATLAGLGIDFIASRIGGRVSAH
jgi:uncharacterized protein (TIGR02186 family)